MLTELYVEYFVELMLLSEYRVLTNKAILRSMISETVFTKMKIAKPK